MYIIINTCLNQDTTKVIHKGNFPIDYLEERLNNNQNLIVISLYSNTIKIPNCIKDSSGIVEWEFIDYPLPVELLSEYL